MHGKILLNVMSPDSKAQKVGQGTLKRIFIGVLIDGEGTRSFLSMQNLVRNLI